MSRRTRTTTDASPRTATGTPVTVTPAAGVLREVFDRPAIRRRRRHPATLGSRLAARISGRVDRTTVTRALDADTGTGAGTDAGQVRHLHPVSTPVTRTPVVDTAWLAALDTRLQHKIYHEIRDTEAPLHGLYQALDQARAVIADLEPGPEPGAGSGRQEGAGAVPAGEGLVTTVSEAATDPAILSHRRGREQAARRARLTAARAQAAACQRDVDDVLGHLAARIDDHRAAAHQCAQIYLRAAKAPAGAVAGLTSPDWKARVLPDS